jgi:hypothetical protein
MLNNYRDLKVWQKSKQERQHESRKNVKGNDKIFRIQTLEPWNPCPRQASLGPSSPIKLEKNNNNNHLMYRLDE